ncbi:Uncharacterised protein [Mycobacteroides abscessus subsp. abscessus]|nr:Uncharacterised protein [Mycobacteroides abscessus subsp. abscessus]
MFANGCRVNRLKRFVFPVILSFFLILFNRAINGESDPVAFGIMGNEAFPVTCLKGGHYSLILSHNAISRT